MGPCLNFYEGYPMEKVKSFVGAHRTKIGVIVGLVTVASIGLWVGDVTLGQIVSCVTSLDVGSEACKALG